MAKPGFDSSTTRGSAPIGGWIVLIAFIALGIWIWRNVKSQEPVQPVVDDVVVVDPPEPAPKPEPDRKSSGVDFKQCILVAIFDKKTTNADPDYFATIQNDKFWENAKAIVKDVEFLDPEDEVGKNALAIIKKPAPVVALFDLKAKKPVWSIPLPKGGVSEIEKRLK